MTRAKIRKFVSAALSAAMCCVAGGAVTPVYAVQYNHVVMEEVPGGGINLNFRIPKTE